jgi:Fur family peroxide stress response transcriptional regulator
VLSQALRDSGLRLTHQRLEVVREIASTDSHPSVESVYRGVRGRVPTISLDTVYRTLATLAEIGLVNRVSSMSGVVRYDANRSRHHHFVCVKCGSIRDVESPELDMVRAPEQTWTFGHVESVEVNFRGICSECAQKSDRHCC